MRMVFTPVTMIRRQIFAEIARLAYFEDDLSKVEDIPYRIIRGEVPVYRESIFKERAIVAERLRLAMGLPVRRADQHAPLANDIESAAQTEPLPGASLIDVIPFACAACDTESYTVTDNCRNCLAHPCVPICPVSAVSIQNGRSHIDREKCIRCGRCAEACPYNAIVKYVRPCAAACGVNAIESDYMGRAVINHDKCVECGMCTVNCPFGAISDKSQLFQLILSMRRGEQVVAIAAPAFVGQFGPSATPGMIAYAIRELGFTDVLEVAAGADNDAMQEAKHYLEKVPGEQKFLATSCCPSWAKMARQHFPQLMDCISTHPTPMVRAARTAKKLYPNAKVAFLSPCPAKKMEAARPDCTAVDFVITFEELIGMMVAKDIDFSSCPEMPMDAACKTGRSYPVSGGVTDAILTCIHALQPDAEVKTDKADGLSGCRKMLLLAKAGKRDGYLLEGMACPGGCIGGAGTIMPAQRAITAVEEFKEKAASAHPTIRRKKSDHRE